jgi:cephalosporin hydroxylase
MRTPTLLLCGLALILPGCRRLKPALVSEVSVADKINQNRLLDGFFEPDKEGQWRLTSRVFTASLDPPENDRAVYLELDYAIPGELLEEAREVALVATVNDVEVGRQTYFKSGRYVFTRYVPVRALKRRPAMVRFELSRSAKRAEDGRTLGLAVLSVGLKEYERTIEDGQTREWLAREGFRKAFEQEKILFPPSKALELKQLFAALPALNTLKFQNLPVSQNPLDLWMIQQIVQETLPEVTVETGTGAGGSALYLAAVLHALDRKTSKILTVSQTKPNPEAVSSPLWSKYVEFRQGDPTDPAIVSELAKRAAGRSTLVLLNSDRAGSRILEQLNLYAPLVSRRGYLVVQHTAPAGLPPESSASPAEAVRRFLDSGGDKTFEQDTSREMMIFTANIGGWLRRK